MTTWAIRPEKEQDYPQIEALLSAAFSGTEEARLVERLRQTQDYLPELALVATDKESETLIGCIFFSRLLIDCTPAAFPCVALAPMAVLPEYQKRGVGSALVQEGLRRAEALGYISVVVLGHPEFYPRFGFQPASRWGIRAPFPTPEESLMAIELAPGALTQVSGMLKYSECFQLENAA